MSTVKKVLIVLGVLSGTCIVTGLLVPAQWRAEASVLIDAPPERIHPLLDDFHNWRKWATPKQADPSVEYSYAGADHGVGAEQRWRGERSRGWMKILESDPNNGLKLETAMFSDEVNGAAAIRFTREGDATRVTWQGDGRAMPLIGHVFAGAIERGVRDYYEYALQQLKAQVEQQAPAASAGAASADAGVVAAPDAGAQALPAADAGSAAP